MTAVSSTRFIPKDEVQFYTKVIHERSHSDLLSTVCREELAEFTHDFRLEQAPRSVVNNAKLAILDCLGVSMLAATQEIGDCLRKFARMNVASGNCTVWGTEYQSNRP